MDKAASGCRVARERPARILTLAAVAVAFLATGCKKQGAVVLVDTNAGKFHVGEKWSYRARPGEEGSSLTVVKVESSSKLGVIVHVSLDGLRIKNSTAPDGVSKAISHMPFAEQALEKSVTTLASPNAPLPAFTNGYQEWRRAFDAGKGGVFTITVAEAVTYIEAATNK